MGGQPWPELNGRPWGARRRGEREGRRGVGGGGGRSYWAPWGVVGEGLRPAAPLLVCSVRERRQEGGRRKEKKKKKKRKEKKR
jgi:hypothetical protein